MTGTWIVTALVVGLVIGAVAHLVLPGRQRPPAWLTIAIGAVAALVGAGVGTALGVGVFLTLVVQALFAILGVCLAAGARTRGTA
ncbi:GlsB/YeaQ/YmgE family stress response membrane protein [Marinactinospora rubrisoli]|uniref:GlsB/YeaQ/YmgE family stress response membrane protein n=1 Tax=Marinactinospora rubrisoli TaxID=2715399 RepID=A0ABW2KG79_9ACTN